MPAMKTMPQPIAKPLICRVEADSIAYPWKTWVMCGMTGLFLAALMPPLSHAAEPAAAHEAAPAHTVKKITPAKKPAEEASAPEGKDLAVDIKAALRDKLIDRKSLTLVIKDKPELKPAASKSTATGSAHAPAAAAHAAPVAEHAAPAAAHAVAPAAVRRPAAHAVAAPVVNPKTSRDYIQAKAAALTGHEAPATGAHGDNTHGGGEPHWAYEGENGPQNWGKLKPEFNVCAIGKRQSPINIEESVTLQGPAEPLQFNYTASSGTVVNNGHTIQVDLYGDNTLTVRGSVYKLVQFHFHTPSEEQVNYRNYAMVAHLVHKNNEGQLAVVAVLLDPGVANPLINKVWTYMPLDTSDRVRMPGGIVDMNELLPKDQRYYQFIGSLTTPPCTEGVLWMVLKTPTQLSKEQIRLFQQLFPNNARPVQPLNGRPVREAQ
ncbi:MAG: cah [Comamonadaceae bacterium]|nr:MAG: cah [Comamonadaceae bacterium]